MADRSCTRVHDESMSTFKQTTAQLARQVVSLKGYARAKVSLYMNTCTHVHVQYAQYVHVCVPSLQALSLWSESRQS